MEGQLAQEKDEGQNLKEGGTLSVGVGEFVGAYSLLARYEFMFAAFFRAHFYDYNNYIKQHSIIK